MAGITLAQAQAQLTAWLAASVALASGKSFSTGGKQVTLADTQEQVKFWDGKVKELTAGGRQVKGITPCN
ncbi:MAG: hypothetical protein UY48_C0010G0022 [Candidatus Gottesmanbacteria bacterium GW2011_GWB1_49_7]|uniref:Uncharacterized protein n=1 Tax=Candidatus Gottesmanbacteria bacterium GW2011_GWB1_49_7 TaxID=1618448 RepID=A0A0G1W285_9BACT|nr:MAG: hypothetical protein UY48_C0010G0022 [Candidatus Gottesmanbacteria bacterium GW2011_GWB1_49_7]